MKKSHQRLMLNLLAVSFLAIAVYMVFIQKEKPFVPAQTINSSAASR